MKTRVVAHLTRRSWSYPVVDFYGRVANSLNCQTLHCYEQSSKSSLVCTTISLFLLSIDIWIFISEYIDIIILKIFSILVFHFIKASSFSRLSGAFFNLGWAIFNFCCFTVFFILDFCFSCYLLITVLHGFTFLFYAWLIDLIVRTSSRVSACFAFFCFPKSSSNFVPFLARVWVLLLRRWSCEFWLITQ